MTKKSGRVAAAGEEIADNSAALSTPVPPQAQARSHAAAQEDARWKAVRAHIAKGDKLKDKSEQHFISAGQYLAALKAEHTGTWAEWETKVKEKAGIGKSRASELMQIASGRKSAGEVAANTTERGQKRRALSPLRNGENVEESRKISSLRSEDGAPAEVVNGANLEGVTEMELVHCGELERLWAAWKATPLVVQIGFFADDAVARVLATIGVSPLRNAWRLASEEERREFFRLSGDDVRRYIDPSPITRLSTDAAEAEAAQSHASPPDTAADPWAALDIPDRLRRTPAPTNGGAI